MNLLFGPATSDDFSPLVDVLQRMSGVTRFAGTEPDIFSDNSGVSSDTRGVVTVRLEGPRFAGTEPDVFSERSRRMKPEHRHELKTNELAEWLSNLPQWARKNLTTIIYISVVTVVVAIYSFWYYYQKNAASVKKQLGLTRLIRQLPYNKRQILRAQSKGVDLSYILIQTADSLQTAAQNIKDPLAAASALIKRADTLRMELHYRLGNVSKSAVADQINLAKAAYSEAIEKAASNPSLAAAAQFGLGLCEEEIGNIAEAKQIYRDLATSPRFKYTTAAAQAKIRLDSMAQYQQKVVFKTDKPKIED